MEQLYLELGILLDLLLSAALGFFIGFERKYRSKDAGIRTHTIVCLGAALMMVVSKYAFANADSARVAAQIVSGIGFLGAGIIVYRKNTLHGLTTAAGIWTTAGIGMACGGRLYYVAIGATLIMFGIQMLLHTNKWIFKRKKYYSVNISFYNTANERDIIKSLFEVDRFNHLIIERVDGKMLYHALLQTDIEYSSAHLDKIITENPYILTLERCDEI